MRLLCGVGINDADYNVTEKVYGDWRRKSKTCPFYAVWKNMIERCYSPVVQERQTTYKGCYVCEEWKYFSNFKSWMEQQDWKGKHLDKDILFVGNKVYSPETCVFVSQALNGFILESGKTRGEWPIGACWDERVSRFVSYVKNPISGRQEYLGSFLDPEEAHRAWLTRKLEIARLLAAREVDYRVSIALIKRYENYELLDVAQHRESLESVLEAKIDGKYLNIDEEKSDVY